MPIKCSNKSCGHTNADGTSYCVKCGQLLGGMYEKKVVIKADYDKIADKIKSLEQEKKQLEDRVKTLINTDKTRVGQIERQQKELDGIKAKGFAPKGYHLEKDKSLFEIISNKTIRTSEYNELRRRANQSWYQKLWDTIKEWWDDTGGIIFLLLAFGVVDCGAIWLIGSIVSSCSSNIKIEQRDGLWGVTRGKDIVIPFECDSIILDKFDTKYSRIYKDGHVGLINNTTGKTIVPCIYLKVGEPDNVSFRGKLIAVKKDNGKWLFVNYYGLPKGRQDQYDYASWWSTAEYGIVGAIVNGEMKYGYVDERGDEKISCKYAAASDFFEGLALVKNAKYGPWICINEDGEEQYRMKYTLADIYQESLIAVTNELEWTSKTLFGFVDRNGELVIGIYFTPWILDDGSIYYPRFSNGKARGRYMGKNGWIDKSGKFTPANK